MPNIGRNDPCPCGSGKKYKNCHGPIDAERATAERKLKQAPDTLLPKIMDALDRFSMELPGALDRFWNGAYNVRDIKELDQHEDRGSERFATWFAFDAADEQGRTPVQRLIAEPEGLELTEAEAQVLAGWANVRLQPYEIVAIRKGKGLQLRPLFGDGEIELEDHKAAKRVTSGEVLITHLVPASNASYVAGAAAHLTADTVDKLREFADIHVQDLRRTEPGATAADLIRSRSYIFNHFVMALPREEQQGAKLDELVARTRAALNVTVEQIGFVGAQTQESMPVLHSEVDGKNLEGEADVDPDSDVVTAVDDTNQAFETAGLSERKALPTTTAAGNYAGQDD